MADDDKVYIVEKGANPCDICDPMEGEYDDDPDVPFHPNCECDVTPKDTDDDNCEIEYRNVQTSEETFTVERSVGETTVDPPSDVDIDIEVEVPLGVEHESWDEEGIKDASGWDEPSGSESKSVTIPAGTTECDFIVELEMGQIVVVGEKWRVCAEEDPVAGVIVKEKKLGTVGGAAEFVKDVSSAECRVLDEVDDGGNTPYFDPDDEVPV